VAKAFVGSSPTPRTTASYYRPRIRGVFARKKRVVRVLYGGKPRVYNTPVRRFIVWVVNLVQ
jgi:hypothetical protein